jgi:hypothetical protein
VIPDREARPYDVLNPMIPRVARLVRKSRLDICKQCQYFTGLERCALCGCFMPAKVMLPHSACPIGKWEAEGEAPINEMPSEVIEALERLAHEVQETAPRQGEEQ